MNIYEYMNIYLELKMMSNPISFFIKRASIGICFQFSFVKKPIRQKNKKKIQSIKSK